MKTIFSLLAITFSSLTTLVVTAQVQPVNGGFENWVAIGSFQNPTGWSSFNNLYSYSVPETSFQTTDAHSGTYALRTISLTATIPPPLGTSVLDTIAGFVIIGNFDMNHPGIPYTDRPESMEAYVKANIIAPSEAYLISTLSKWNSVTHTRDQVAIAMYYTDATIPNYISTSTPFVYNSVDIPDTLDIRIMGGNVGPGGFITPGCEFFVDDISFTFSAGLQNIVNSKNAVFIYPNPALNKITIQSEEKINSIKICNLLGEEIISDINLNDQKTKEFDLSNYQSGIYLVKVNCDNGTYVQRMFKE